MYRFLQKLITAIFFLLFVSFLCIPITVAQQLKPMIAIAGKLKPADITESRPGLIVAKDPTEYYITRSNHDQNIAGVIVENPDLLYTFEDDDDLTQIAIEGNVDVWVSNSNGSIILGDPITSSTNPGIGVKADNESAILGFALESIPEVVKEPVLISVQLDLTYAKPQNNGRAVDLAQKTGSIFSRLLDNVATETSNEYPRSFLYLAVILIIVLANIFGFMVFGRIAVNGIYAVGRNPMARATIIKTILINVGMTILFTVGSMAIALLILRF